MNTQIELEAKKYARRFEEKEQGGYNGESLSIEDRIEIEAFIAGVKSNAAKEYWYKQFEKEKLEFAIEQIRPLENICWEATLLVEELEQKLKEQNKLTGKI